MSFSKTSFCGISILVTEKIMGKKQFGLFTFLFLIAGKLAEAQQRVKVYKIGLLLRHLLPSSSSIEAFRQGLREFGYLEGQNIAVEYRVYERSNRLADFAAELVQLKVDVIVANSTEPALAAKKTTKSIPIVFTSVSDPVGAGLVTSLARPGGNVTGLAQFAPELSLKRLELLKEVVPRLSRVAVLWSSDRAGQKPQMKEIELAANALRLRLHPLDVPEPPTSKRYFIPPSEVVRMPCCTGLSEVHQPSSSNSRPSNKNRLPSVYVESNWVEAGGQMSYGPNTNERWRRAAYYVDKILRGAKPAELPVERPMKFEFVINLKAAKDIGLTIPGSVSYRVDRVVK
jgi:putative tryptophan/tyrosine transport system substrate-binding protein